VTADPPIRLVIDTGSEGAGIDPIRRFTPLSLTALRGTLCSDFTAMPRIFSNFEDLRVSCGLSTIREVIHGLQRGYPQKSAFDKAKTTFTFADARFLVTKNTPKSPRIHALPPLISISEARHHPTVVISICRRSWGSLEAD